MADIGEIISGIRTAWLGDSTLVGMLGSSTGIYRKFPRGKVAFPIIVLDFESLNPQGQMSAPGLYRPALEVDIFAVNPYTCETIFSRLQSAWSIPEKRAGEITLTNFRVTLMHWENAIPAGQLRVVDTDEAVHQLHCPLAIRASER